MTDRTQIKHNYYKITYFVLLCLFLMVHSSLTAHAGQKENLDIKFSYGFEGITKADVHTPVTVSISNHGAEFKGKVRILISSVTPSNSTIETVLLNGYKEKNYMYEKDAVIVSDAVTNVSMIIPMINQTNRLKVLVYDEYDNIVAKSDESINSLDYYYYYVYAGVLTQNSDITSYFKNTGLYQYNDYTFKSILLNKEQIPSGIYGLDMFQVLVVDEKELNELSKEQKSVIYNWQKNGGLLVNLDEKAIFSDISWEKLILETDLKKLDYTYTSYTNWSITSALSNVFMKPLPNFFLYVVILMVYIILVGPIIYVILKKLNKRRFFWLCEILASVFIMIVIILVGNNTRLKAPFINYFKIVTYNENTIDNGVYFNIRAPFNNEYKLYLDKSYSLKPIYDYAYYDNFKKNIKLEDYNVGITKSEKENIVTIRNDVTFTKEYFYAEKTIEKKGEDLVRVDMNMFGDKISGTVVNNLDEPIENAAIFLYNKVILLDTIPANSTVSLEDNQSYTYNPKFKFGLSNEVAGLKIDKSGYIKEGYVSQNQKKTILDFYLEKRFSTYTDHAYLVGFTSDTNQLELQLDSSYDAYGKTMLEVPIDVNYEKDGYLYTTYVPIKNEEYSFSGDVMYTNEMILTYSLGENLSDIQLFFNNLGYYDDSYYKNFSGHIYFYNPSTMLYEPFDLSTKEISVDKLKLYLNEKNEIIMKFVEPFDKEEKQALLPSLSTIGRVNDARN